jgi:hypothetical protein
MGHHFGASFRITVVCQCLELVDPAWDLTFYALTEETKATEGRLFLEELGSIEGVVAAN